MEINPAATPPEPPTHHRRVGAIRSAFRFAWRSHLLLALIPVFLTGVIVSGQVEDRADFANTELARGVEDRWGEPVRQPAPSLRAVESGSVFTELRPMPFDSQHVRVEAAMNYRKRGLKYFSGFDFTFRADYAYANGSPHDTGSLAGSVSRDSARRGRVRDCSLRSPRHATQTTGSTT